MAKVKLQFEKLTGRWFIKVPLKNFYYLKDIQKAYRISSGLILNDIRVQKVNAKTCKYVREQNDLNRDIMDFMPEAKGYEYGTPQYDRVREKYGAIAEKWSDSKVVHEAYYLLKRFHNNKYLAWQLGGNDYLYIQPHHYKPMLRDYVKKTTTLKLKKNEFTGLKDELLKLYAVYHKWRNEASQKSGQYMKNNGREFAIARTMDLWFNPKEQRNKAMLDRMKKKDRDELLDEYPKLRKLITDKDRPHNDIGMMQKVIKSYEKRPEIKAKEIYDYLVTNGDKLAKYGGELDCQKLFAIIAGDFFLSESGQKYFKDYIEPFIKGDKKNEFLEKVWPRFPTQKELDDEAKKWKEKNKVLKATLGSPLDELKNYYALFNGGMGAFGKMAAPLAAIAKGETKEFTNRISKLLEGMLVDRYRIKVNLKVAQTTITRKTQIHVWQFAASVEQSAIPSRSGKAILKVSEALDGIGKVLTPINVFLALFDLASSPEDDKKWVAMVGELAGALDAAAQIRIVQQYMNISSEAAQTVGKVAGVIGGAANVYVGTRDYYSHMEAMEPEQGFCDLLIVAGGLFGIAGVFSAGIFTIIGAILALLGGLLKWLFMDTPREKYIKATNYYKYWGLGGATNYMVVSDMYHYYSLGKPNIDQILKGDYYVSVRLEIEIAGAFDVTLYTHFFADKIINEQLTPKPLELKIKDGRGHVDIPVPLKAGGNEPIELFARIYQKEKNDLKKIKECDLTWRKVPAAGKFKLKN